ncbi:acetolactate synthase, small subunit [Phytophthora nicotianae CJ01A1]|uniref:Acetolactate synthase, small subunit, variant n=6 Tax=Phytophthora nicotianae TaxID=4792 RepID=W2PW48_PHYN3|nr:acetolactate synthase, small subunit, variant [Phytophthora nicotianae INRA-310]ETI40566.1 acetolactate synthase, small subunit, variant [Phytophthora nicotianae P1569]ETK80654.1 acetolactate synthase, small subunit [Phytophthora nicotianae]ETO69212.1 acetolactate synthase, small subunit, variant [Phytophthora nicotianae P1976]ETP10255.1 acetolactate synthase, small subunit [Phytophthora nicotianae CJ01A1]ETP38473.1 acetolactate synthase, small subunit [Phytophthora nicotianae P10297]
MLRRSVLPMARRAFPRSTAGLASTSATPKYFSRAFSVAEQSQRHVIAALVVNQPGCLAEIANLFAARGYNIDSLVVGRTEVEELSRMTVVVNGTAQSVVNMKKQLEDVVYVAVVNILSSGKNAQKNYVERDLMLAKVSTAEAGSRAEVVELANLFDAKVIDVRPHQVMVQLAGTPGRIEAFLDLLKPLGITEIHRSGVIAMARSTSVTDNLGDLSTFEGATRTLLDEADDVEIDVSRLPPG